MVEFPNIERAESTLISDMKRILTLLRNKAYGTIESARQGNDKLREIRKAIYENLNQLQHEYLLVSGIRWLIAQIVTGDLVWSWNPRQTGDDKEPDIRAVQNGKIIVSAEATTSQNPVGTIDQRMKNTLLKLERMPGKKYYFVTTSSMAMRAKTKVTNLGLCIHVVELDLSLQ